MAWSRPCAQSLDLCESVFRRAPVYRRVHYSFFLGSWSCPESMIRGREDTPIPTAMPPPLFSCLSLRKEQSHWLQRLPSKISLIVSLLRPSSCVSFNKQQRLACNTQFPTDSTAKRPKFTSG